VALQFLGNLFEFFLVRKNEGKVRRGELTVHFFYLENCVHSPTH